MHSVFREPALRKCLEGKFFSVKVFSALHFFLKFKDELFQGLPILLFCPGRIGSEGGRLKDLLPLGIPAIADGDLVRIFSFSDRSHTNTFFLWLWVILVDFHYNLTYNILNKGADSWVKASRRQE